MPNELTDPQRPELKYATVVIVAHQNVRHCVQILQELVRFCGTQSGRNNKGPFGRASAVAKTAVATLVKWLLW
jgi:hypothetical protein